MAATQPPMLDDVQRAHLIGIGGTAMTPLATILLQKGVQVSGSDLTDAPHLQVLRELGARIELGHRADHVVAPDIVVTSSAVPTGNPEIAEAIRRGIPVVKHSAALGSLMRRRKGIAIAGTHGKTTTSALTSFLLDRAGFEPTFHVGSELLNYGLFGRLGNGPWLVAEADEYDRRFLDLDPQAALVTSVEPDHLDFFGSFDRVIEAFERFLSQVRQGGVTVVCADDPVARSLATGATRRITYGSAPGADWLLRNWRPIGPYTTELDVQGPAGKTQSFRLNLVGHHNALNATGVVALCTELGVSSEQLAQAMPDFRGTRRRFQVVGQADGVTVVDDYAHHPTAIRVTLAAARAHQSGQIWAIFQPHTAHRTESLLDEFARCFTDANHVLLTPTYRPAGRESEGIDPSIQALLGRLEHSDVQLLEPEAAADLVGGQARPGDLVLVMGAGDIWQIEPQIVERLRTRETPK